MESAHKIGQHSFVSSSCYFQQGVARVSTIDSQSGMNNTIIYTQIPNKMFQVNLNSSQSQKYNIILKLVDARIGISRRRMDFFLLLSQENFQQVINYVLTSKSGPLRLIIIISNARYCCRIVSILLTTSYHVHK